MIRRIFISIILIFTLPVFSAVNAQDKGLRLHISVDMEGLAGVVTGEQLGPGGFEYERFREFMTGEANAAIEAAFAAGATEIVVADSHGNMQNLLIEKLPDNVTLVRASPRPLSMMQGIEDGRFDGAIFIGYHAGTTEMTGVRAHTMSSARLTDVKINGEAVNEAAWNAAVAGYFGVPVIMISGDDATVAESRRLIGDLEGAVVKWNYGFHSARSLTPAAAQALIREKVSAAISRIGDFAPVQTDGPVTIDIAFKHYRAVELLGYLPNVERTSAHSIRFVSDNMVEAAKMMEFITSYDSNLSP